MTHNSTKKKCVPYTRRAACGDIFVGVIVQCVKFRIFNVFQTRAWFIHEMDSCEQRQIKINYAGIGAKAHTHTLYKIQTRFYNSSNVFTHDIMLLLRPNMVKRFYFIPEMAASKSSHWTFFVSKRWLMFTTNIMVNQFGWKLCDQGSTHQHHTCMMQKNGVCRSQMRGNHLLHNIYVYYVCVLVCTFLCKMYMLTHVSGFLYACITCECIVAVYPSS